MNKPSLPSRTETFPGCYVERWERGSKAESRVRKLRRVLVGRQVTTRSGQLSHRWTAEVGSDRTTVATLEITYCARPAEVEALPLTA